MFDLEHFEILDERLTGQSARKHFAYEMGWGRPAESDLVQLGIRT